MSQTTTETKKAHTFTEKEIRKHKKKARQAEEKFKTTQETSWLNERDKQNDIVIKLLRNQVNVNKKKKQKKKNNQKKTDDQLLNEAISQNRRERNEREKIAMEKEKKKNIILERRAELKRIMSLK